MTTDFLFRAAISDEFVSFSVFSKKGFITPERVLPFDLWAENLNDNQKIMRDELESLCEEYHGTKRENSLDLPHHALVCLTDSQAMILGLPPAIPFALDLKTHGIVTDDDFFVSTNWVTSGGVPQIATRRGAFVHKGSAVYRLPSPLYEITEAAYVLAHHSKMNSEQRFKALATLNELLPPKNDKKINVNTDFGSMRILHASAFSLQVPSLSEAFHFDPILFSRKAIKCAEDSSRILDEGENL